MSRANTGESSPLPGAPDRVPQAVDATEGARQATRAYLDVFPEDADTIDLEDRVAAWVDDMMPSNALYGWDYLLGRGR